MSRVTAAGCSISLTRWILFVLWLCAILQTQAPGAELEIVPAKTEPHILNLALPNAIVPLDSKTAKIKVAEIERSFKDRFQRLYCSTPNCAADRALQINIALGNDYQILDWLGKGWIDAAVISPLSLYLLNRDHLDLVDVGLAFGGLQHVLSSRRPIANNAQLDTEQFWQEIWQQAAQPTREDKPVAAQNRCRLALTSHLSTASFLASVAATSDWLNNHLQAENPNTREEKRNRFWSAFFDRVRFTFDLNRPAPSGDGTDCAPLTSAQKPLGNSADISDGLPEYHFVISSRRAAKIFSDRKFPPARAQLPAGLETIFPPAKTEESDPRATEKERRLVPAAFRPMIFSEPYFGNRIFNFTIDETINLLRQQQQLKESALALILPGGGVKAGFQSRLIEHLYGSGELKNYGVNQPPAKTSGGAKPLDVGYIIGTSGGALLGFFVAQLDEREPPKLSKVLWELDGKPLKSSNVFGAIDLLRYFSFLAILAVLWLVLWSPLWRLLQRRAGRAAPQGVSNRYWRWRMLMSVAPILALAPLLVRYVNGPASQEHIPEVEGVFYALCVLIAMFADQSLILGERPSETPCKGSRLTAALGFIAGATLVAAAVVWRCQSDGGLCQPIALWRLQLGIQPGALLACVGVLCLLIASIAWIAGSPRYRFTEIRGYGCGVGAVGLFHILLVYALLWLLNKFFSQVLSFLELTLVFWCSLLIASLLIGAVFLWASFRPRTPCVFRDGFDYLWADHPNGMSRRFSRLLLLGIGSTVWWNVVVAPGLYGNKYANESITKIIQSFDGELARGASTRIPPNYLTARLIIPANVLERDGTRYFLFAPEEKDCPDLVRRPADGATWRLFYVNGSRKQPETIAVRRCGATEKGSPLEYLRKVVFASGSPFPIFPAHRINNEALVDGGYSNNVPIDAAQTVSSDLVLIIESSHPLGPEFSSAEPPWYKQQLRPGELIGSLSRLLAFLWERSQQIDRLSRSDLFVASLAPPRDEANWPFLVDFREQTMNRVRQVAERNLTRRIGMVQSWGRPHFQFSIRLGEAGN